MTANNKNNKGNKAVALSVIAIVLAVMTVGTTIAYIIIKTTPIGNIFLPPVVDVDINLNAGAAIEDNSVQNVGDIPVFARVSVVATWENDEGQIYSTMPNVEITLNSGWEKGSDGFYYLIAPLLAGASSSPIQSVTPPTNVPAGYTLRVQVVASVIQSSPTQAVIEAWGINVDEDGNLILSN